MVDRKALMRQSILLLALPILVAACASPRNTRTVATSTAIYRVDIHAEASVLAVGGTVTVRGIFVGSFGNPMYYLEIKDLSNPPSDLRISLTRGNEVRETTGASNVLEVVSTNVEADRIAAVLRARARGRAEVVIAINGEIAETDGSNTPWFNYVTTFSEGWTITVE
jgi:hypothetical protein